MIKDVDEEKIIILGAGSPHLGHTPSVLFETGSGKMIMNWVLDALNRNNESIEFIGGYKAEKIKECFPEIPLSINEDWKTIVNIQGNSIQDYLIQSYAFTKLGETKNALLTLDYVNELDEQKEFSDITQWYRAFTLLNGGMVKESKAIFEEIRANPSHAFHYYISDGFMFQLRMKSLFY